MHGRINFGGVNFILAIHFHSFIAISFLGFGIWDQRSHDSLFPGAIALRLPTREIMNNAKAYPREEVM